MDNNQLMTLLIAFVLGYFAHQMMRNMCGGRLVEGIGPDDPIGGITDITCRSIYNRWTDIMSMPGYAEQLQQRGQSLIGMISWSYLTNDDGSGVPAKCWDAGGGYNHSDANAPCASRTPVIATAPTTSPVPYLGH